MTSQTPDLRPVAARREKVEPQNRKPALLAAIVLALTVGGISCNPPINLCFVPACRGPCADCRCDADGTTNAGGGDSGTLTICH